MGYSLKKELNCLCHKWKEICIGSFILAHPLVLNVLAIQFSKYTRLIWPCSTRPSSSDQQNNRTDEEQNLYYFKLHDINNNNDNRLDGLEIIAASNHRHQEGDDDDITIDEHNGKTTEYRTDEVLTDVIDDILEE